MCVGIINNNKIMSAKADQSGDLLVLVGLKQEEMAFMEHQACLENIPRK